jgi:hypothetical protein
MNKKRLALIGVVAVLIIVVVTVVFAQTIIQNSNTASSPSSSVTSSSSLTQDEIATLKADSLELEIKDLTVGYGMTFTRIDNNLYNATVIAQATSIYTNYNSVSETAFLGDINNYVLNIYPINPLYFESSITRIGNTFYLKISSTGYPEYDISVSCTP